MWPTEGRRESASSWVGLAPGIRLGAVGCYRLSALTLRKMALRCRFSGDSDAGVLRALRSKCRCQNWGRVVPG